MAVHEIFYCGNSRKFKWYIVFLTNNWILKTVQYYEVQTIHFFLEIINQIRKIHLFSLTVICTSCFGENNILVYISMCKVKQQ